MLIKKCPPLFMRYACMLLLLLLYIHIHTDNDMCPVYAMAVYVYVCMCVCVHVCVLYISTHNKHTCMDILRVCMYMCINTYTSYTYIHIRLSKLAYLLLCAGPPSKYTHATHVCTYIHNSCVYIHTYQALKAGIPVPVCNSPSPAQVQKIINKHKCM